MGPVCTGMLTGTMSLFGGWFSIQPSARAESAEICSPSSPLSAAVPWPAALTSAE